MAKMKYQDVRTAWETCQLCDDRICEEGRRNECAGDLDWGDIQPVCPECGEAMTWIGYDDETMTTADGIGFACLSCGFNKEDKS